MEYLSLGWQAFVVGLTGAMVPGPLFTLTVAETIRRRWLVGIPLIAGHAILETLLVMGLIAGLGTFLVKPQVMSVIGILGGAMLWWLGYGAVKDAWHGQSAAVLGLGTSAGGGGGSLENPAVPDEKEQGWWGLILRGITLSAVNPYWVLWWATMGTGFIAQALRDYENPGVAVFLGGHLASDGGWYLLISWAALKGRRIMSPRAYRLLLGACGIFLIYLGTVFFFGEGLSPVWRLIHGNDGQGLF